LLENKRSPEDENKEKTQNQGSELTDTDTIDALGHLSVSVSLRFKFYQLHHYWRQRFGLYQRGFRIETSI
jgi:hypothetical protein